MQGRGIKLTSLNLELQQIILAARAYQDNSMGIGEQFWVAKAGSAARAFLLSRVPTDKLFTTLEEANVHCAASQGDKIFIAPGHTETLAAAATVNLNRAGVRVFGLGNGADRPKFTFSATASTITMTAASVWLKNIIVIPSIDSVVSPIVVSAADCIVDIEVQDASATVECVRAILTTADADNLIANVVYKGFIAGNACVNAIRLVGCNNARINVDFYGVASTSIIEFHTTACSNIKIFGNFYNSGTTDLSKNVVDTVTGSTWSADAFDSAAGAEFSGGSGNAIAAYAKETADLQERVVKKVAATMVTAQVLFTIAGGPIEVLGLVSICETGNDATASTLQYNATPTVGAAATISGASASLAAAAAGASVALAGTALATAALLSAGGPNLIANPGTIMVPIGTINIVVGVGSTTGTWAHYLRYKPLAVGVTVV